MKYLLSLGLLPALTFAGLNPNIHPNRGTLNNARATFESNKTGHVAFIGGSITQMNGYRPMMVEELKKRFPGTAFTFTDAGLSSTCSTSGAFRLEDHILKHGKVDLLYIEFAVNDDQDAGHSLRDARRGMEGIIRHVRTHNPYADVVVTHFVNPHLMEAYRKGEKATSIAAHDEVSEHYHVPVIDLAKEIQEQIDSEKMSWNAFGGVHPKPFGNRHCADMHGALLDHLWQGNARERKAHKLPKALDKHNYEHGRFVSPKEATGDWKAQIPDWKGIKGSFRADYAKQLCLAADQAGQKCQLTFTGRSVGGFVLAGPDAGCIKARVDGGAWRTVDLFHRYSGGLHYPRTVMFATDLKDGEHALELEIAEERNPKSKGHAARILHFTVNGLE
jgi:lysophospholipase L1-like esterase